MKRLFINISKRSITKLAFTIGLSLAILPPLTYSMTLFQTGITQAKERYYSIYPHTYPQDIVRVKAKNLESERFLTDLEVEVTNVSNKPIYYIGVLASFPTLRHLASGDFLALRTEFGRSKLMDYRQLASSLDENIAPGETKSLKLSEKTIKSFEKYLSDRGGKLEDVKEIKLVVASINLGDGTKIEPKKAIQPSVESNDTSNLSTKKR